MISKAQVVVNADPMVLEVVVVIEGANTGISTASGEGALEIVMLPTTINTNEIRPAEGIIHPLPLHPDVGGVLQVSLPHQDRLTPSFPKNENIPKSQAGKEIPHRVVIDLLIASTPANPKASDRTKANTEVRARIAPTTSAIAKSHVPKERSGNVREGRRKRRKDRRRLTL